MLDLAAQDISAVVGREQPIVVVGEDLRARVASTRCAMPFLECDGEYGGNPLDGETAIRELDQIHDRGAEFIAFAWTAFWWLEAYPELTRYLGSRYQRVLSNDRLVLFDLRSVPCKLVGQTPSSKTPL